MTTLEIFLSKTAFVSLCGCSLVSVNWNENIIKHFVVLFKNKKKLGTRKQSVNVEIEIKFNSGLNSYNSLSIPGEIHTTLYRFLESLSKE